MIRDVNFFGGEWGGGGQRGLALGDVTLAIRTIWQGRSWRNAAQFAGAPAPFAC